MEVVVVEVIVGTAEAAKFLGVSENTARRLARHGFLPFIQGNSRGDYRFVMSDLQTLKDLLASGWKPSYKN